MRTSRILLAALLALLTVGVLPGTASAIVPDDEPDGQTERTFIDPVRGIIIYEAEYTGSAEAEAGGVQPMSSTGGSYGGMSWSFKNVVSSTADNTKVHHYYAWTKRTAGSGDYLAHVHAALSKWNSSQGMWDSKWSVYNDTSSCPAEVEKVNAPVETCRTSPWQSTGSKGQKWLGSSGHYFDVGNDGTDNGKCPGCIDIVYTRP